MDRKPVIGKHKERVIRANYPMLRKSMYYKMKKKKLIPISFGTIRQNHLKILFYFQKTNNERFL